MSHIQQFTKDDTTIYWGDVLDVLQSSIPNQSIQLIFADPPYNIGKKFGDFIDKWESETAYLNWCYRWLDLCLQKLTPDGSLYLMASTQAMPYLDIYLREKIHILSRIIWAYDSSGVQAKNHFGSSYEPILYGVMDSKNYIFNADKILVEAKTGAKRGLIDYRKSPPAPYNTMKVPNNVWQIPRVRYRMPEYEDHPSQKPIALLERIILASSNVGDTVLDLFSGTFTTSYVAQQYHRKSIGIELQKAYIKIGLRRLAFTHHGDKRNNVQYCPKHPQNYRSLHFSKTRGIRAIHCQYHSNSTNINIPILLERLAECIKQEKLHLILQEIILQSRIEFNMSLE